MDKNSMFFVFSSCDISVLSLICMVSFMLTSLFKSNEVQSEIVKMIYILCAFIQFLF